MPDNQVTIVHSTASVDDSTTEVVAAASNRKYLRLTNLHATITVFLRIGAAATLNTGIRLGPVGGTYEMRQDANNVDPRVINGIGDAAGPSIILVAQA